MGYSFYTMLQVFDGGNENAALFGSFCGTIPPPLIRSSSNTLLAKFVSGSVRQAGSGFIAMYNISLKAEGKLFCCCCKIGVLAFWTNQTRIVQAFSYRKKIFLNQNIC